MALFSVVGLRQLFYSQAAPMSTAVSCVAPTQYPAAPSGGLTYVNWYFDGPVITSLTHSVTLYNDPGTTSDLYLQLYDANIDGSGQYYGLQTTGTAIFSRFGTVDAGNVKPGPGATVTTGTNEGPYVSLRYNYGSLPAGAYTTRMVRGDFDGTGDWFSYYVNYPGQGERLIGAIRFPRAVAGQAASFKDGGGSWTEFWDNNGNTTLYTVPQWHVAVQARANDGKVPNSTLSSYSPMPNSDIFAQSNGNAVEMNLGGGTSRCHTAGWLWFQINKAGAAEPAKTQPKSSATPKNTTPVPTSQTKPAENPTIATPGVPETATPTPTAFSDGEAARQRAAVTRHKRTVHIVVAGVVVIVIAGGAVAGVLLWRRNRAHRRGLWQPHDHDLYHLRG